MYQMRIIVAVAYETYVYDGRIWVSYIRVQICVIKFLPVFDMNSIPNMNDVLLSQSRDN